MKARVVASRRQVDGCRYMAAVEAPEAADPEEIKDWIMSRPEHPDFFLLFLRPMPEHWFSPARRTDREAEAFLYWWNYAEELCIAFNREMARDDD